MPIFGSLSDLIYEQLKKASPFPLPEAPTKARISAIIDNLTASGWRILPPGADLQEKLKVQGTSVRCPGCGALDPDLGFKSEVREIPQGEGRAPVHAAIVYIFCAKETCHTILNVVAAPVQQQQGVIQ